MDIHISLVQLYELVRAKTDQKTAEDVVSVLQNTIKEEVKQETMTQVNDVKVDLNERVNSIKTDLTQKINDVRTDLTEVRIDLIDRINTAKLQTILWVVGVGILQLAAKYFFA